MLKHSIMFIEDSLILQKPRRGYITLPPRQINWSGQILHDWVAFGSSKEYAPFTQGEQLSTSVKR